MNKFFCFDQNNSGGVFHINDEQGISPIVWVEAFDVHEAIERAKDIGIYFNGVQDGWDCECCGDRWNEPWNDEGESSSSVNNHFSSWHDTVYVHRADGTIERIKENETKNA